MRGGESETENGKKSFLLYLDTAPALRQLTAAQRGDLLMALYDYAERAGREDVPLVQAAEETGLEPAVQTVFLFMASAIRRDTEKWRSRRDSYRRKAQGVRAAAAADTADTSWMRPYIELRDRQRKPAQPRQEEPVPPAR